MKIVVFSDSHGKKTNIDKVLMNLGHETDCVIFLGDGHKDIDDFEALYPNIRFVKVLGNCDMWEQGLREHVFELAGKRFFITHGHMFYVKNDYDKIIDAAREISADICMFGHTHLATVFYDGNILFINPGNIGDRRPYSYGVIEIIDDEISANIAYL